MGKAVKGSQRSLQLYVNPDAEALNNAIVGASPSLAAFASEPPVWVSPVASSGFREYLDAAFLDELGLGEHAERLAVFWPKRGPVWDGLARVADRVGRKGVILVEAKSHASEMASTCKAEAELSVAKIRTSLNVAREHLDADPRSDWTVDYYQYANRLAHLYFLDQVCKVPAWLVFVYFFGDAAMSGPGSREEWLPQIEGVKAALGIPRDHALADRCVDVFLPASPKE